MIIKSEKNILYFITHQFLSSCFDLKFAFLPDVLLCQILFARMEKNLYWVTQISSAFRVQHVENTNLA